MPRLDQFNRVCAVDVETGSNTLRIEGVRIKFQVKRNTLTPSSLEIQSAEINIYNLAEATRNALRGSSKKENQGDAITLWAGYASTGLKMLYHGNITQVGHMREPPEVRTQLMATNPSSVEASKRVSLSYDEGTLASQVLADLVKATGLAPDFLGKFQDGPYLQGWAFEGPIRLALEKVTERLGLAIRKTNKLISFVPKGQSTGRRRVLLTADSGLIGSPERVWIDSAHPEEAEKRPPGWKVKCLLRPEIECEDLVGIHSREINPPMGFKAKTVQHDGDTHGDEWFTTSDVVEPGVPIE